MVLSRDPETIWRLSAEKETERTSLVWPTKRRVVAPVASSHRRSVLSQDAERAYAPSDEMTCFSHQRPCSLSTLRKGLTQSETM